MIPTDFGTAARHNAPESGPEKLKNARHWYRIQSSPLRARRYHAANAAPGYALRGICSKKTWEETEPIRYTYPQSLGMVCD